MPIRKPHLKAYVHPALERYIVLVGSQLGQKLSIADNMEVLGILEHGVDRHIGDIVYPFCLLRLHDGFCYHSIDFSNGNGFSTGYNINE